MAKIRRGMIREILALRFALLPIKPTRESIEITAPAAATNWRRRISPLPILQVPGMYSWLN